MLDSIKPIGNVVIKNFNSQGDLIDYRVIKNLVVTTGKQWIAGRLKDSDETHTISTPMTHIAIGENTHNGWPDHPSSLALTTLKDSPELFRSTISSSEINSNTITYVATFNPGQGTGAIVEAGIFNNSSDGTMLCRTEFDTINKGSLDTMVVSWEVSLV